MLEIYQIASDRGAWDISYVPSNPGKKEQAKASAKEIARRLQVLEKPLAIDSEREWVRVAGVSSSFFTNLRNGSDPSVNNLRLILEAAGSSLPEFFRDEARTPLVQVPSKQALEQAIFEALDELPARPGRRAEYLAEVVQQLLALPPGHREEQRAA
ncbi:MAG TPA: hypothetical protein VFJ46_17660 [Xanthobacteraceae bacterium]|nr:hypothetical protein [Xanthobacteraceae bacterium]